MTTTTDLPALAAEIEDLYERATKFREQDPRVEIEPLQASPVIVEDGAFVGSRCVVVEGVRVGREAVLGANVVLTASTPILVVRGDEPVELRGEVPPRAIVIPGTRKKKFPAGSYRVPCALIIGERSASTDRKTSLTEALREHAVSV